MERTERFERQYKRTVRLIYAAWRRTAGLSGSDTPSDQQVPIAPDRGTEDVGQIAEVQKHHIGPGRREAKLDFPGQGYEAFFERGRERALVEVGEPKGDCRSGQRHD